MTLISARDSGHAWLHCEVQSSMCVAVVASLTGEMAALSFAYHAHGMAPLQWQILLLSMVGVPAMYCSLWLAPPPPPPLYFTSFFYSSGICPRGWHCVNTVVASWIQLELASFPGPREAGQGPGNLLALSPGCEIKSGGKARNLQ